MAQHGTEHYTKLATIFQNVLSNLEDPKYQQLNAKKIHELFAECNVCIDILHSAGFERSNQRLILDVAKMDDMIAILETVKALVSSDSDQMTVSVSTTLTTKPLRIEKEGAWTYEVVSASSKDEAYRYLKSRTVTQQLYYVIVETPDGNFGKDIMNDIFEEPAKNPKTNINLTELTHLNSLVSDENHVKQYRNLKTESAAISINTPSLALLPSFNARMSRNTGQRCDVTHCQHLDRLCVVLQLYHVFIDQKQNKESTKRGIAMHDICNDEYNTGTASVLDDFHHLLHNHDHQFEYIHNYFVKECKACALDKCSIAQQHYSNEDIKMNDYEAESVLSALEIDQDKIKQIVALGFPRDKIQNALIKTGNVEVNVVVDYILGHQDETYDESQVNEMKDESATALAALLSHNCGIQETVQQEILNKIHCYYFHSFDIGCRLRQSDKQKLLETEQKTEAKVADESDEIEYDLISTARALQFMTTNKAHTNIKGFERITARYNKFKSDIPELVHVYDHGIRYFYWPYFKDKVEMDDVALRRGDGGQIDKGFREANKGCSVKEWYIEKKYNDLKDELLHNEICRLSEPKQYALLREQATKHLQTLRVKAMMSRGRDVYNIKDGVPITLEHLIAMMVYANKDVLQAQFSETFRRRQNENNASMIKRHRNYANFGRLLRELVECFGQNGIGNRTVGEQQLLHGISKETQFGSVMTRLKGPVSATTDCFIAFRFAGAEGLILQFSLSEKWIIPSKEDEYGGVSYSPVDNRCAFLDCHWLSDYPEEQERFFIGGYGYFYFENIYNIHDNHDYILYIQAIRMLSETVQCSTKHFGNSICGSPNTKSVTQMAFRLLSHELHKHYPDNKDYHPLKDIPPYIDQLFHNYCTNAEILSFYNFDGYDYKINFDHATMKKMLQSIFFYDNGLIKWPIVTTVFSSLDEVWIESNCHGKVLYAKNLEMLEMDEFWTLLLIFLKQRNKPLITIDLECAAQEKCLQMYKAKGSVFRNLFRAIKWDILLQPKRLVSDGERAEYRLLFVPYGFHVDSYHQPNYTNMASAEKLRSEKVAEFADAHFSQFAN
eukprot:893237_1